MFVSMVSGIIFLSWQCARHYPFLYEYCMVICVQTPEGQQHVTFPIFYTQPGLIGISNVLSYKQFFIKTFVCLQIYV
jgi:hypothetical protein